MKGAWPRSAPACVVREPSGKIGEGVRRAGADAGDPSRPVGLRGRWTKAHARGCRHPVHGRPLSWRHSSGRGVAAPRSAAKSLPATGSPRSCFPANTNGPPSFRNMAMASAKPAARTAGSMEEAGRARGASTACRS